MATSYPPLTHTPGNTDLADTIDYYNKYGVMPDTRATQPELYLPIGVTPETYAPPLSVVPAPPAAVVVPPAAATSVPQVSTPAGSAAPVGPPAGAGAATTAPAPSTAAPGGAAAPYSASRCVGIASQSSRVTSRRGSNLR